MFEIAEFTSRMEALKKKIETAFSEANIKLILPERESDKIRLVFVGQYSAGKSSILKMLTGMNNIGIGAGITTQNTHTYDWNGLEVVDTPGIHTELRQDHDEISYQAIASADMLVFVITNELFDAYLANHFRKLAIDKDKAGEMILVVNKMSRTAEGNTDAQKYVIQEDLRKVLEPYTPEQLNLSFLDAESYLNSLDERDDDPEYADELVESSGYVEFINTLNSFVSRKKYIAGLTTDLYIFEEQIQQAIKVLEPKSTDRDIDGLEENIRQQRYVLFDARSRLQQEIKDIFISAANKIRDIGRESANLVVENCEQDAAEQELKNNMRKVEEVTERCQLEASQIIETRINEMGHSLDSIENSEFTQNLEKNLIRKFEGFPDNVKKVLRAVCQELPKLGETIVGCAYNQGVNGGLKLTNFSNSTVHNAVLKIGRSIGYKFKPWEASKFTKNIAIGGKVLGAAGVCFSIAMQIEEDKEQDKRIETLRINRQNIRSNFNSAACALEDYSREFIQKNVVDRFETPIKKMDEDIRNIIDTKGKRNKACKNMIDIQNECTLLIRDIHATQS